MCKLKQEQLDTLLNTQINLPQVSTGTVKEIQYLHHRSRYVSVTLEARRLRTIHKFTEILEEYEVSHLIQQQEANNV